MLPGVEVRLTADRESTRIVPELDPYTDVSGVVRFIVTDTEEGTVTLTAAAVDGGQEIMLNARPTIRFVPQMADAAKSSVTASKTAVAANDGDYAVITVRLADRSNQPVPGWKVRLESAGSATVRIVAAGSETTGADGKVSFAVYNAVPETVHLTAVAAKGTAETEIGSLSIRFVTSDIDPAKSSMKADPAVVPADGVTPSIITAELADWNGNRLANRQVRLESNIDAAKGYLAIQPSPDAVTDERGTVAFAVYGRRGGIVSFVTVDLQTGLELGPVTVQFRADPPDGALSSIKATKLRAAADGRDEAVITVTLATYGNRPLIGESVTLYPYGHAEFAPMTAETDAFGLAEFRLTHVKAGEWHFRAVHDASGLTLGPVAVAFVPGPIDPAKSGMAADRYNLPANGSDEAVITIRLADAHGNPIPGRKIELSHDGRGVAVTALHDVTDGRGEAKFAVKGTNAENVTFTARTSPNDPDAWSGSITIRFLDPNAGSGPVPPPNPPGGGSGGAGPSEDGQTQENERDDSTGSPDSHEEADGAPSVFDMRIVDAEKLRQLILERLSAAGSRPVFPDLAGHWAEDAIRLFAMASGIAGYPDGTYRPDNPVTRAEFAIMLAGLLGMEPAADWNDVNGYARDAVAGLLQAGILYGYEDGTFRPQRQATRAETAAILLRLLMLDPVLREALERAGFES